MKLGDWMLLARQRLEAAGIDSAALEARLLAAHCLSVEPAAILAHPEVEAPPELEELLQRREGREPLAYILGWREFNGRRFEVSPAVLIPRHETETLVEAALSLIEHDQPASVWDLGTGSGCLAITIKLERPLVRMLATDISPDALDVARRNAVSLSADVEFLLADLSTPVKARRIDLIVSNPPYVSPDDALMPEVGLHEPGAALFAEEGGLAFFRRMASELPERGALVALEVGDRQATAVRGLFEEFGWRHRGSHKDLLGIERVLIFEPESRGLAP